MNVIANYLIVVINLCDPAAMPNAILAAALVASALSFSAFAQGTTSTPCPPDDAKAKARKILGGILKNTQIAQAGSTQPCTASPPATATPASPAAVSEAPAASPASGFEQPKPGTNRIVRYNGHQTAITTGADDKGEPVTYLQIPGQVQAQRVRQTGPDSYVMLTSPPAAFSVVGGEVVFASTTAARAEVKPVASGPAIAGDFGIGSQGMIPFNGGGGVQWQADKSTTNLQVFMVSQETRGHMTPMFYEGHDGNGNHYLKTSDITMATQYFKLTVSNGVAKIQGVQEVPEGLNRVPNGSTLMARNDAADAAMAGDSPAAGTISDNPLQLLDPTDAILTLPDGRRVSVTRPNANIAVWTDKNGNRYSVHGDRVVALPK